jgi:hypothetical protein
MDDAPLWRDLDLLDGPVPSSVRVNQPVPLQPGQPAPSEAPQQLQVFQGGVPAVEEKRTVLGLKPRASALRSMPLKCSFLVEPPMGLS